jgi:hypothetical protein
VQKGDHGGLIWEELTPLVRRGTGPGYGGCGAGGMDAQPGFLHSLFLFLFFFSSLNLSSSLLLVVPSSLFLFSDRRDGAVAAGAVEMVTGWAFECRFGSGGSVVMAGLVWLFCRCHGGGEYEFTVVVMV